MELIPTKTLQLFAGSGNPELSNEIAQNMGMELGDVKLSRFANGELYCRLGENVRGADVFVLQGHCDPINDHIMEQLIMIDALKRASARRITAVCPSLSRVSLPGRPRSPGPATRSGSVSRLARSGSG